MYNESKNLKFMVHILYFLPFALAIAHLNGSHIELKAFFINVCAISYEFYSFNSPVYYNFKTIKNTNAEM